jgi:hypothetical protein
METVLDLTSPTRRWHYHAEYDGRYYIVPSGIPGETIDTIWTTLDESMRQHYAERIVHICQELAVPAEKSSISGVDGNALSELYAVWTKGGLQPPKSTEELLGARHGLLEPRILPLRPWPIQRPDRHGK